MNQFKKCSNKLQTCRMTVNLTFSGCWEQSLRA